MSKRQTEIIEAYERDAAQTPRASENMRAYYAGRLTARQAIDRGGLKGCEEEYRHLLRTEWGPCPTFTSGFEAEMHLEIIRIDDEARASHAETADVAQRCDQCSICGGGSFHDPHCSELRRAS